MKEAYFIESALTEEELVDKFKRLCRKLKGEAKVEKRGVTTVVSCSLPEPRDLTFEVGYDIEHDQVYLGVRDEEDRYVDKLLEKIEVSLIGLDIDYGGIITGEKEDIYNEDYHTSMTRVSHGWIMSDKIRHIEFRITPEKKPKVSIWIRKFKPL